MSGIYLSFDFIDKYVRFAKPEYLQVYLYVKGFCLKNGLFPSAEEISSALDMNTARVNFILEYWRSRDELLPDTPVKEDKAKGSVVQKMRSTRPSYSQAEIDAAAVKDKQLSGLFYQAESILKKVLTASDMELLFSFNDWLGLPVEVILMLLSYAAKSGKTSKRYLETVAIDWAEKGINSYEAAEAYISELEAADSAERSIRNILGIYDRALSATEKKYIKLWTNDYKVPSELISEAYDRTIERTGKLSWSYMNKMIKDWTERGFETTDDVKAADEEFYKSKGITDNTNAKKSKKKSFDNYEDSNKDDYAALNEQILDMMLDT